MYVNYLSGSSNRKRSRVGYPQANHEPYFGALASQSSASKSEIDLNEEEAG